jgi:hypothetical protein
MTENYSHNMKLLIVNNKNIIYEHQDNILQKVYMEIANKVIRKQVYWSGSHDAERSKVDFAVLWHRKIMKNDIEKIFLGDLFTISMVCDTLLYSATGKILLEIQNKIKKENMESIDPKSEEHQCIPIQDMDTDWKIIFYISKLIDVPAINYKNDPINLSI